MTVRMKWSLEIEEQFNDLSIISMITADKSPVRGNFEDGVYIKGKKTEFEKVLVCEGRLGIWLPIEREKKEYYGKEFVCPDNMELYEEYVCEKENYGAAFEVCQMPEWKEIGALGRELAETFREEIEEKYLYTHVSVANIFEDENLLCYLVAEGELENETVYSYVYFIRDNMNVYRCYFFSGKLNWKEICYLAEKIMENIEIIGKSDI